MHFCIHRFTENLGVDGVDFALENALLVEFLRLVAQHQNDLVFGVQSGIIVVIVFGSRDPIAREYHLSGNAPGRGEIQRHKVLLNF